MSLENYVFLNRMPSPATWGEAIAARGYGLRLPSGFDYPRDEPAFVPCRFEDVESGFDLMVEPLDLNDFDFEEEHLSLIGKRDTLAMFRTYSNAQEVMGMIVASGVLAADFDGVLLADFFEDELLVGSACVSFIESRIEGIREQFEGPSRIRQALLRANRPH